MTTYPTRSRAIAVDFNRPGAIHRTEIDVPELGPDDVLIKTIRTGVCGTDREIIHGAIGAAPEGANELVIGHELLGRVLAIGDAVPNLAPNDLVTATVRRPDGCRACQAGYPDMCLWQHYQERGIVGKHGFMTEYVVEQQTNVVPVPDDLEHIGILVEPLTIIEKAMRHIDLMQSSRVPWWEPKTALVLGAGPIGILGTMLLRLRGVEVITAARSSSPNTAASVIDGTGARYISTRQTSLADAARELGNIDIVLECSGHSPLVFESMRLLGLNGVLGLISVTFGDTTVQIPSDTVNTELMAGNKLVAGFVNAGKEDFVSAVEHIGAFERRWPGLLEHMFTARIDFDDDVSSIVERQPGSIKTLIEFGS